MSRGRLLVLGMIVCMALALSRQMTAGVAQPRPDVALPAAFAADVAPAWLSRPSAIEGRQTSAKPSYGIDDAQPTTETRVEATASRQQNEKPTAGLTADQRPTNAPSQSPITNHQSPVTSQQSPLSPLQASLTATVTAEALNVRAGPGLGFEIISQVHQGDRLTLLSEPAAWPHVRTPSGVVGYVSAAYIMLENADASGGAPADRQAAPGQRNPFSRPPSGNAQGRPPAPGWFGPPAGSPWAPPGGQSAPNAQVGEPVSDDAGNSVRVTNRTGGTYSFDTEQLLKLLRDENIAGENVTISLVDSEYGNRSSTTWGSLTIDCNPITVPVEAGRPNPPGNGKTGAAFCNAVALHEVYHLIQLQRSGWGGSEPDADAFALSRLKRYTLVR